MFADRLVCCTHEEPEERSNTVHRQVWIIIPNIVEVVFLEQKNHLALMKWDQALSEVQPARWSLGWGEFHLPHLVGKGEAFPDSSDSQITHRSVWIISLSSLEGGQNCTVFWAHTHTHTQTSTCQFLCAYHLIKASPCSFFSTENCSSPSPHLLQASPTCWLYFQGMPLAVLPGFLRRTPACLTSCTLW